METTFPQKLEGIGAVFDKFYEVNVAEILHFIGWLLVVLVGGALCLFGLAILLILPMFSSTGRLNAASFIQGAILTMIGGLLLYWAF